MTRACFKESCFKNPKCVSGHDITRAEIELLKHTVVIRVQESVHSARKQASLSIFVR
jgi:hypothetical protein